MDIRTAATKSIFSDILSGMNPRWTSHLLKRQALDVKRDPKGNFLELVTPEARDTGMLLERLKTDALTEDKVSCARIEIFISNICGPKQIEFCKRSSETVASSFFATGLVGVLADEVHEVENLTANNSVFICKCKRNQLQYKPHVNCDELVINASLLREDFEKIEVVATSSYIIEAGAIYFWYSVSPCHVIIRRKMDRARLALLPDDCASTSRQVKVSSPIKTSVVNEISNGILAESRRAKRPRLKSCLKKNQSSQQSTSHSSKEGDMYVVDDEVHVMCETLDLTEDYNGGPELSCRCDYYQQEVSRLMNIIEQKDDEIEKLVNRLEEKQQEVQLQKATMDEREVGYRKLEDDFKNQENKMKDQKKVIDTQKKIIDKVRKAVD